jgi:hypothetical protein
MDFYITNRFTSVTNIAVRLTNAKANANAHANANTGSILINTHYDSALGGLGATDAGALVAVMMEMLRNILNSDEQHFSLNYPLVSFFFELQKKRRLVFMLYIYSFSMERRRH